MKPSELPITAVMITCGGAKITTGEAIRSFEMQTHPNKKMIIVCTHPDPLRFSKPLQDVEIVKAKSADFKNLAEKTIFALSLVKTEAFYFLEHDDVVLPRYFETLAKYYVAEKEARPVRNHPIRCGHNSAISAHGGVDKPLHTFEISQNLFFCRFLYEKKDGHYNQPVEMPFDLGFSKIPWHDVRFDLPNDAPGLVSRWDSGDQHASGHFGSDTQENIYRKCEDIFMARKNPPIEIVWKWDYVERAKDAMRRKGFENPPEP